MWSVCTQPVISEELWSGLSGEVLLLWKPLDIFCSGFSGSRWYSGSPSSSVLRSPSAQSFTRCQKLQNCLLSLCTRTDITCSKCTSFWVGNFPLPQVSALSFFPRCGAWAGAAPQSLVQKLALCLVMDGSKPLRHIGVSPSPGKGWRLVPWACSKAPLSSKTPLSSTSQQSQGEVGWELVTCLHTSAKQNISLCQCVTKGIEGFHGHSFSDSMHRKYWSRRNWVTSVSEKKKKKY